MSKEERNELLKERKEVEKILRKTQKDRGFNPDRIDAMKRLQSLFMIVMLLIVR